MNEGEKGRLITEGEHVEDLMKHPGMMIIRDHIKEARTQLMARWWRSAEPEEAERARQEAKSYEAFFNIVKLIILKGKQAKLSANPPSAQAEQGA